MNRLGPVAGVVLLLGAAMTVAVLMGGPKGSVPEREAGLPDAALKSGAAPVHTLLDPAIEEGLQMVAERTQCEIARLASRGQPLWARLQILAGCGHRQERKIDALESELSRFREADALERAYWAHLYRAGLTRRVEHVPR